jgi:hypothetical protein
MLAAPPSTENRLFQPKSKDLPRLSFFHFGIAELDVGRLPGNAKPQLGECAE